VGVGLVCVLKRERELLINVTVKMSLHIYISIAYSWSGYVICQTRLLSMVVKQIVEEGSGPSKEEN